MYSKLQFTKFLDNPEEAIELNRGPSEEDIERMMLEPEFGHKLHEEL